jgi:hypothetical protein
MSANHVGSSLALAPVDTPVDMIAHRIHLIRSQKVMLDSGLADLYQVATKRLNEAVHRNLTRFPADFMFQLTADEAECLRSQIATSNGGRGGRRNRPYAFTELGVAMLSSVLNSERAVQMNIVIMRAFVKLREALAANHDLAHRIAQIEAIQDEHASIITIVVDEINALKEIPPEPPRRPIGFTAVPIGPSKLPDRDPVP